jgi:CrcB protein
MLKIILIFLGGGLGSLTRYGTGVFTTKLFPSAFPVGTLISNILACILLAVIVYSSSGKLMENSWVQPLLLVGFCGGFSTFSSFSNETVQLINTGNYTIAIANILVSLLTGLGTVLLISQYSK